MSAEPAPAQRISPQQSFDDTLGDRVAGNANEDVNSTEGQAMTAAAAAEEKKKSVHTEEALLEEVSRTWTTGKNAHQTTEAKSTIKRASILGIKPRVIAKHVVLALASRNQPSEGEDSRVRKFVYNINKELKKDKNQGTSQPAPVIATKTSETEESLAADAPTKTDAPTIVMENGGIYFQENDVNKKRKAIALEGSSMNDNKKMDAESMNQERHCMEMWLRAKDTLKKLREELKDETEPKFLLNF